MSLSERIYHVGPPQSDQELTALLDFASLVYNMPREMAQRYAASVGHGNFRLCRLNGEIVAGMALIPCGQYFGARSVPMNGIALVATPPQHRGRGAASALLRETMLELRASGWPISALYPATVPLYRRAGYELAGSRHEIHLHLREMNMNDRDMQVRPITSEDRSALEALHRERSMRLPGNIDRTEFFWKRVASRRGEPAHGYAIVNDAGELEGAVHCLYKTSETSHYEVHLTDYLAATPGAARRLLTFVQDHFTLAEHAILWGSVNDPLLMVLPERTYHAKLGDHWMLRMVDVGAAMTQRGWPVGATGEIHLDVEDDVLNDNNGRYIAHFSGSGGCEVATGGRGDMKIDIRGLASLYAGFVTPRDLISTGHLSVASHVKHPDAVLNIASTLFAGPSPSMVDGF